MKLKSLFVALVLCTSLAFANNSTDASKCKPAPKPKPPVVKPCPPKKTPPPPVKPPCPKPTPPPEPKPIHIISDLDNSNKNISKNTNTNTATAAANSAANAASTSSAVVGPITNTNVAQGGNATASLSNAGNSTNDLKNTQGQSQSANNKQSQTSTSAASNNGNGNGNGSNNTTFAAPKIPVNTAYAPEILPTAPCIKGVSGGAQTAPLGITFGAGKVDEGCDIRQEALTYLASGSRLAYCKVMLTSKRSKKAGITLEDCMGSVPTVASVPAPIVEEIPLVPSEVAPSIPVVVLPPPAVPQPVLLADCELAGSRVDNKCKALLDTAVLYFRNAEGGYLVVTADAFTGRSRATNVIAYLVEAGINKDAIRSELKPGPNKGAQVLFSQN